MIYLAAFLAVVAFLAVLVVLRVVTVAAKGIRISADALAVMRDSTHDDSEKEQVARRASLVLMRSFASMVLRAGGAVAASVVVLLTFEVADLAGTREVAELLASWPAIIAASTATVLACVLWGNRGEQGK